MSTVTTGDAPVRRRFEQQSDRDADSPAHKEQMVERLFEAFSRRDLESILDLVHKDIIFFPLTANVTRAGDPYRGHEGMRRYVADVVEHWPELSIHAVQIRAAGKAVVILGMASGRGAAGSFENVPATWVLKFRDGLVARIQIFSDARHVTHALGHAQP
jgi:ketosteroid isomerase-like protein